MCARGRSDAPAACTGWMHADLYPGNFLLPGGRLGMVDSGAAAATPGGIPAPFGQLAAAVLGGDGPTAIQLARQTGGAGPACPPDRGSGPSVPANPAAVSALVSPASSPSSAWRALRLSSAVLASGVSSGASRPATKLSFSARIDRLLVSADHMTVLVIICDY